MVWRDKIEIHEAAERFPMMSDSELNELASDIKENGMRSSIVLWTPERAEDVRPRKGPDKLYLLDGRNRLEALERSYSDDLDELDGAIAAALDPDSWPAPAKIVCGEEDPFAYVVSANIHRRHLTTAQKRDTIAELLRRTPGRSDLATARIAHVSDKTVASVRSDLTGRSEIPNADTRIDSAGRQQPARKSVADVVRLQPQPLGEPEPVARDPFNDSEVLERQIDALMRAWNAAAPEARQAFLERIDRPVFGTTKISRGAR